MPDDDPESDGPADEDDPESDGPMELDEPESDELGDDGSNSIDPADDELESLDEDDDADDPESVDDPESLGAMGNTGAAEAVGAPNPNPSTLAATTHATAMPANARFVLMDDRYFSGTVRMGRPRCAAARTG